MSIKINKIVGIQSLKELESLDSPIEVSVHLKRPSLPSLVEFEPKIRRSKIKEHSRSSFQMLKREIGNSQFIRIGSQSDPRGLKISTTNQTVARLNELEIIERIFIKKTSNSEASEQTSIYAMRVRFMIQIENRTRGIQDYEDRILLVKARNEDDAKGKLQTKFPDYEEPYLNTKAELVRWKFECFLDSYETDYTSIEDMAKDESTGIEVLSILKGRRLKSHDHIWKM